MIKICSPQLGISQYSSLGGEIYDYQTLKGFTEKGFKVLVYLPRGREYDKSLKNFRVSFAPIKPMVPPWIISFICLPYLIRTYKKEKFEVIRVQTARFTGVGALIFKHFFPKVKMLVSAVNVEDSDFYYPIEKVVYRAADRIIVQSEYMKSRIVKRYQLNRDKIFVTFGGMYDQIKTWSKIPTEAKSIGKQDRVIVYMGVLVVRKNPIFLYEIFKRIRDKIPNSKLVIIGSGSEKNNLVNKGRELGIEEDVVYVNKAYGEEKAYWFSRADLCMFPSKDEGFGLVATEAMSFGKPVITSNRAAFEEIIENGKDGFALPLENKKVWVESAVKVLKDKEYAKNMGRLAKKKVEKKFSWDNMYELNKKVVEGMIG